MPRESGFIFDSSLAGNQYPGRVLKAREMTAGEFDSLRGATLAARIGAEQVILYLENDVLDDVSGRTRAYYFMPDTAPVSKWIRFLRSLEKQAFRVMRKADGSTNLEGECFFFKEGEVETKKYGIVQILEVVGIPTPEDIAEMEAARGAAVMPAEVKGKAALDADLVLSLADGLAQSDLKDTLEGMDLDTGSLPAVLAQLFKNKRLAMVEKKLKVL